MDMGILATYGLVGILIALALGYFFYDIYLSTRPDRLRVFILDASLTMHKYRVRVAENSFTLNEQEYTVIPGCIYKMGMLRMPTSYYTEGVAEPHDLIARGLESEISARQYHERTSNKIIHDIINAFSQPMITPTMSFVLLFIAIIGGVGYLWWDLGGKLDDVIALLQAAESNGGPAEFND